MMTRAKLIWLIPVVAVLSLGLGVVIGDRLGDDRDGLADSQQRSSQRTPASPSNDRRARAANAKGSLAVGAPPPRSAMNRSRVGAASAAAFAVTAFSGDVLLDQGRLQAKVDRIAARGARASLLEAFSRGSEQVRQQLGSNAVPKPVVILRAFALGYRVESYSSEDATVAIWNVGVVGSGATGLPRQSWGTERVSLVWERDAWRVAAFANEQGPTPPLANSEAADSASDLFTRIPTFAGFAHAVP